MKLVFLIFSLIFLLSGMTLRVIAWRNRTELGRAIKWYHVKYWFMPWKTVDLLTPKGMKLSTTSIALIMIGITLFLVVEGLPALF